MMSLADDLISEVATIFRQTWTVRDGTTVPESVSVKLSNDGVRLDGTVLYADMADSTRLVDSEAPEFAAEIYKAYLHCAAKIISNEGGEITAFDGDRIMSVFLGSSKNSSAATAALKINYVRAAIINPAIKAHYPQKTFTIQHAIGIDSSKLLIARTGIRGSNDLVWVGRASNYAAKLTTLDAAYPTWITGTVYDQLNDGAKLGGDGRNMWEERTWIPMGNHRIFRSKWWWRF